MSSTLEATGWAFKLAMAIASATVIGGGTMVLNLHRNDAVQDEKLIQLQTTMQKMDSLDDKLDTTLRAVAVLNVQLRQEDNDEPRK
jgi:hypothetical protein